MRGLFFAGCEAAARRQARAQAGSDLRQGVDILGVNVGGEVHTFTPVKEFGGGLIQILNDLSGNPVITPECSAVDDDDKVAPGGKYQIEAEELAASVDADGIARVQCCIHPWMRSEIHMVHSSN